MTTDNDDPLEGWLDDEDRVGRVLRARMAAYTRWANEDARDGTAAAREAFMDSFEKKVDPDGVLPAKERKRRADAARKAHFTKMAYRSWEVRRARKKAQ